MHIKERLGELTRWTLIMSILFSACCFLLYGCLGSTIPQTVVVEKKCIMPEMFPKSKLSKVKYVKEGENGCTYYRCLTEEEAQNAVNRESALRRDCNSCRDLYNDNRDRCGK